MLYFWLRWWSDAKLNRESNIRTDYLMNCVGQGNDREYRDAMNEELDRRHHKQRRAEIAASYRNPASTTDAGSSLATHLTQGDSND